MLPIKTVLHPTDFSDSSTRAFQLACSLAQDYGAKLLVLHVAQVPMTGQEMMMWALAHASAPELRQRLEQMWPQAPHGFMEHRRVEGDPVTEILRTARETKAEVIVLGTHGRRGVKRLVLGSVAEQVIRRAGCPVVTVKNVPSELPSAKGSPAQQAHRPVGSGMA